MAEQKKNDWIATLFFSPDKTIQDLASLGINTSNSSIQDINYYKNIPEIQQAFKTEVGGFDNTKFTKYYNEALRLYNEADQQKLVGDLSDFYTYDPENYFAPIGGKERNVSSTVITFPNPERRSFSLISIGKTSDPTMSLREVAQQNKIFNVDTKEFEDWTPNDWGGLSALTRPTLVLAQWDEDGTHEVNGRIVSHKKGEYKFNSEGDPYYETLGNRQITGKDVLHLSDTLTIDGSKWNKYDFFDSDGLSKSTIGTLAKTAFRISPMFIPGAGKVYGGFTAALELGKLLPALYKSIEGIITGDISSSKSAQTANDIQAYFKRFEGTISDQGRQGFFNFENIGKLIGDSSMQLFQQRQIAKLPLLFTKGEQISESTIKWGRGMSLAYMAGTSSIDAYDVFKEAGASDRIAGLGMISVMGAMFGLMNNNYFRDVWYKNTYLDRSKIKSIIKKSADEVAEKEFTAMTKNIVTPKEAANWVINMKNSISEKISKMKPGDLMYDSFNEGVEETMEEAVTDAVKAFYSGLNTLGIIDKEQSYNFGINAQDILTRYTTSFVGGSIGGAVFSFQNKWESRNNPVLNKALKDGGDGFEEIVYLLRDGKENQLRTELDKLHKAGKLGSTNLSGTEFELVKNGNIAEVQYKSADSGNSQNDLIYKQLNYYIDRIKEVIKEENLDLNDNELQFITEQSKNSDKSIDQIRRDYLNVKKTWKEQTFSDKIISAGLHSQIFQDWQDLTSEIIKTKINIEELLTPSETESKTPKDIENKIEAMRNNSEYQQLRIKLDNLRSERDDIISGKKNDYYTGQLLFAANPQLVNQFVSGFGIHNFTKYKYHKDYDNLTQEEKTKVDQDYQIYSNTEEKSKVLTAYDIFYQMQEQMASSINEVSQKIKSSSDLYVPDVTEYDLLHNIINDKLNQERVKLEEIKNAPSDTSTKRKIAELNDSINYWENRSKNLKNYKYGVLHPVLTESGYDLLKRPNVFSDNVPSFSDYAVSYKDYLKYIKDNNLYLDLIDSDLVNILQDWIWLNNISDNNINTWKEKTHEYLTNIGIETNIEDPLIENIAQTLKNIIDDIKLNDINAAINHYNNFIDSETMQNYVEDFNSNPADLINNLLPRIDTDNIIDYLKDIQTLKLQINSSPVYDLLETASKITGTDNWDILNLIKNEQLNFINSKSTEDYLIKDKDVVVKLRETIQIINAINAILDASVNGGFNYQINKFKESLNKSLLPIISSETNLQLKSDLNRIASQLKILIDISELNQSQKLREQKDITINMRQKLAGILLNSDDLFKQKFNKLFNIDLDKLKTDLNIPLIVNEDNYKAFELGVIDLEDQIYNHIAELQLSTNEISKRLISLFSDSDLINGKPTKFSKDPTIEVTAYDKLIYLTTIISTPSTNFYIKLKEIISNSDFDKAPIFSQEYAARIGYSYIARNELFNSVISQIKTSAQNISNNEYLKTKSILRNFITVYGGAGVGKTKGVAYLLKLLFSDSYIITCAPSRNQTNNLSDSIKHKGVSFTKNELIEKILGRPLEDSDIIPINDVSFTSKINLKVSTDNIFGDNKNKILFIDEISWFNRIELEVISKWAVANNINVIGLGDYKQNASSLVYENKLIDSGIEDTFTIKTPNLIAPLRPDNIAKYDNYIKLSEALDSIYEEYYNDSTISIDQLNKFAKQYLNTNKITLKYFEDNNNFGGEKIISKDEIQKYIDKFKNLSDNIAIITDKPEKYSTVSNIKIISPSMVQGDEFDYVIVDKTFGNLKNNGAFYRIKDLYTLAQRSRKGTIIVDHNLTGNIRSILDMTSSGNIEIDNNKITEFKNWRVSLLDNLSHRIPEVQPVLDNFTNASVIENDNEEPIITENDTDILTVTQIDSNNDTRDSSESKESTIIELPSSTITQALEPYTSTLVDDIKPGNIKSNEVKELKSSNPIIPVVSNDDSICTAMDYSKFVDEELIKFYKTSEFSLSKYLGLTNPDNILDIHNLLRSYFVYGGYKTDLDEKTTIKNHLLNLIQDVDFHSKRKIQDLLNNSDFKFEIIPYNNKGLLIVKLGNENTKQVYVPLLVTAALIGEYNGEIDIISAINYQNDEPNIYPVDISEFKDSHLNPNRRFIIFNQPIVFAIDDNRLLDYDDAQKDWIKQNNGRTFFLISENLLTTETDFKNFLIPTLSNVNNKLIYTTQHNSSIQLIGANWLVDFQSILKNAELFNKTKNIRSIINGYRAGRIIGLAYKVAPNIVINRIKTYLNSPTRQIKIKSKTNEEILIQNTDIEDTLKKYENDDIDIIFGSIKDAEFVPNIGEYTINYVFKHSSKKENFSKEHLQEIEEQINDSFKQKIYGWDRKKSIISGDYYSTDQNHHYVTNVSNVYGNNFKINKSKINNSDQNQKLIHKLNRQLHNLGINKIITDEVNILNVIEEINKEILSTITMPNFELVSFDGNNIKTIKKSDIRYMIANRLEIPVETINISDTKTSKFVPFYVSLQDQTDNYIAENKNGNWEIKTYSISSEYSNFFNFIKQNSNIIKQHKNIDKYILALLNNDDISLETAKLYLNEIRNNITMIDVTAIDKTTNIYLSIQEQVDKFLKSKLENYEC